MIKKGDRIHIKPEWQDAGDEMFDWVAITDEEKGKVNISVINSNLTIKPLWAVDTYMVEKL